MPFPRRIGPTVLLNTNAVLFTATMPTLVSSLTFSNTDVADRTVRINLVPAGSSLAQGNRIVPDLTIRANDVAMVPLELVMAAGDTLQGLASVTSVVNVTGTYGDEKKVLK